MTAGRSHDIAIAGAGIAGLTAALACAQAGHKAAVFERAAVLEDVGAGIQLSPNAMRILERLDLGEAVAAIAFEPQALAMHDALSGARLATMPFRGTMRENHGAPYFVVHRADLQQVLLAAARANPAISIETGTTVGGVVPGLDGVTLEAGAIPRAFDAVIAADGLRSALRTHVDPSARIAPDGQIAWRGTVPLAAAAGLIDANATSVFMGRGCHMVTYCMGGRDEINLVLVTNANVDAPMDAVRGWNDKARALAGRVTNWLRWPLMAVECRNWVRGRVALIGDAAHAMTPHAAQGGAMAIEDAFALATCLSAAMPVEDALARYAAARQPRVARVASLSIANRDIYQAGGLVALGRNTVLRAAPPAILMRRMDWLYGGE